VSSSSDPEQPRSSVAALGDGPVQVLVVDDQDTFRAVLCELVAATDGFDLAGEAESGPEALATMAHIHADFVLMDIRMPEMNGVQAAIGLLERYPDCAVLLISVHEHVRPELIGPWGEPIPFVCKAELRPRVLQDVWETHRAGGPRV
jgi:PleD family two-component response regulator